MGSDPSELEERVLSAFASMQTNAAIFRKTSCAVAFAHGEADYNGHYGIREICDICPEDQVRRCRQKFEKPSAEEVAWLAAKVGGKEARFSIGPMTVEIEGLDEQRRYFIQHGLGFQVHDPRYPHRRRLHGRADIGWQ